MRTYSQVGVMLKPLPSPPPVFVRISDRDLTEIELHSVDSINDLHRTHSDQSHKVTGSRPPRPQAPSTNGNLQVPDRPVVCQTGHPMRWRWRSRLRDVCTATGWRYSLACSAIALVLLALIVIFSILVQQGGALQTLSEVMKERQATTKEISDLMQELQALRHNLTAVGERH